MTIKTRTPSSLAVQFANEYKKFAWMMTGGDDAAAGFEGMVMWYAPPCANPVICGQDGHKLAKYFLDAWETMENVWLGSTDFSDCDFRDPVFIQWCLDRFDVLESV